MTDKQRIIRALVDTQIIGPMLRIELADAVAALDVCTPAERSLVDHVATETLVRVLRTHGFDGVADKAAAVLAERAPPDPVEVFIARMRNHALKHDDTEMLNALSTLDAARGRK